MEKLLESLTLENLMKLATPLVKILFILVVGHFVILYAVKLFRRMLSKTKLDVSLVSFLTKTVRIVLYVLMIVSALSSIGISTTGIIAALSACGLAVAVALKDSLSNVAGGILLLLVPRFATGDFIDAAGNAGTVLRVDLLHTMIRTPDNRRISIPNGVLINSHIINYSHEAKRRVDINFTVSYDADVEKAKSVILEVINAHPMVLKEDAPMARVSGYKDSSVEIISRAWCNSADYWNVYFDVMENVRVAFDKNGIEIPYNQLDVHIKEK